MLKRVGAERTPALGVALRGLRVAGKPERFEAAADAEVGRHERVTVAERAHCDVGGGLSPDARKLEQWSGVRAVREVEIRCGKRADRRAARARAGDLGVAQRGRRGPAVREPAVVRAERLAVARYQARGVRARGGDADLLAEDRAHGQLEAVDVAWDAPPRSRRHQWRQHRVGGQDLVDRELVGVLVAQAPSERRVVGADEDRAVAQRPPVLAAGDLLDAVNGARREEAEIDPRSPVWLAALAGAIALLPGGGGRRQERAIAGERAAGARRPAVDARGAHGDDEGAVVAAVAFVADAVEIEHARRTHDGPDA